MNVIPQYKVIGPYNYDRIMYNIKKIVLRDKIYVGQTSERFIWFWR